MLRFTNNKSSTQNGLQFARGFALCDGVSWANGKSVVIVDETYCDLGNNFSGGETTLSECTDSASCISIDRYPYSSLSRVLFRNAAGTEYIATATTVARHRGMWRRVIKITFAASPLVAVKMWDRSGALSVSFDVAVAGTPRTGTNWKLGLDPTLGAIQAMSGALGKVWVIDNTGDAITDAQCLAMAAEPASLAEETTKGRGLIAAIVALNDHWTTSDDTKDATLTVSGAPSAQAHTVVGTASSVVVRKNPLARAAESLGYLADMPSLLWDMACAYAPESLVADNGEDYSRPSSRWLCALGLGADLVPGGAGFTRIGDAFGRGACFDQDRDITTNPSPYLTASAGGPVLVGSGTILSAMRLHGIFDHASTPMLCRIGLTNTIMVTIDPTRVISIDGTDGSAPLPSTPFFFSATSDGTDTMLNIEGQTQTLAAQNLVGGNANRADDFFYLGGDSGAHVSKTTVYSFIVCTGYKYPAAVAALRTLIMERHGFRTGNPTKLGVCYGTSRTSGAYCYRGNSLPSHLAEAYWQGAEIHNCGVFGATLNTLESGFDALCNNAAMLARVAGKANRWITIQGGDNELDNASADPAWNATNPGTANADWITAAGESWALMQSIIDQAGTNYGFRIVATTIPNGFRPDTGNDARNYHGVMYYFNTLIRTGAPEFEGLADIAALLPFARTWDTPLASITQTTVRAAINPASVSLTGLTLTFVAASGSTKATITRSTGSWVSDGIKDNDRILFGGAINAGNNNFARVAIVSATILTVISSVGTITAEAATASCTATVYHPQIYNPFDGYLHLQGQAGDGQSLFAGPIRDALAEAGAPGFSGLASSSGGTSPLRNRNQ